MNYQELEKENKYYVYFLIDPRNMLPFYIGKGCGKRAKDHLKETEENTDNIFKVRKINSIRKSGLEPLIDIVYKELDEDTAYDLEEKAIAFYGRKGIDKGGILTNRCPNNRPPNAKGMKRSKECCDNISKSLTGKPSKLKGRKRPNIGNALRGRKRIFTDEHCQNMSKARKGKPNPGVSAAKKDKTYEEIYGEENGKRMRELRKEQLKPYAGNRKGTEPVNKNIGRKILCVELNIIFGSVGEAARYLNLKNIKAGMTGIHNAASGRAKSAHKYHWKFVD